MEKSKITIRETLPGIDQTKNLQGPQKHSVHDPSEKAKTTIKETTEGRVGLNHLNVSHISSTNSGAYINSNLEAKEQNRNIGDYSSFGNIQGQGNDIIRTFSNL